MITALGRLRTTDREYGKENSPQIGYLGKEPGGCQPLFGKSLNQLAIILGTPLICMSMLWLQ